MEFKCIICGDNDRVKRKNAQQLTAEEFKKGFTLFCKLLINSTNESGGRCGGGRKNDKFNDEDPFSGKLEDGPLLCLISGEEEENVFGGGDEEDAAPPFCKTCTATLEEVIRLDKVIQDVKLSQLFHVNSLKEALISSKSLGIPKDGEDDDTPYCFWRKATSQLINKCVPKPSSVNQENLSQGRRKSSTINQKKVTTSSKQPPEKPVNSIRPCRSSQLSDSSHSSRQSKLKAFENLRKLSTQSLQEDDDDQLSRSPPSGDDDQDFIPVKEEPQEIDDEEEDDGLHNDISDHLIDSTGNEEYAAEEDDSESDTGPPPKKTRFRSKPRYNLSTDKNSSHTVYLISENLYIFKNTFIKYLPSFRHFQCQEISCPHPIIHRTFTSSDFTCIQTHVTTEHSFSSSSSPSEIILRWCPHCAKSFSCNSFKTERLFTAHLHSCYGNKHKTIICSICGKPCLYVDHLMHFWSHKNTQDKISSIKAGDPIPSLWKRRVLSRKGGSRSRDPFYSLICNREKPDEQVPPQTAQPDNKTEKQSEKLEDPPKKRRPKYRKNTAESIALRTCPTCGKIFKYLRYLDSHLLTHLPEENREYFECVHCSKKLMSAHTLRNHMERVHRGKNGGGVNADVMIQCSKCPQQFYHRDTTFYKAHMKMHEDGGDMAYICDKCGKRFWWKRYLDKHRETHKDKNEDRVTCDKCGKHFKQRRYLLSHWRKAHKETI